MADGNLWEIYLHGSACHSLSCPVCLFPRLSPNPPVIGAGLSNSEIQFTRRQPGIKVAAKGRIASSENAENADLDPCSCSWVWRFGGLEDLKANPWSGGTNGSKIELPTTR